MQDSGRHGDSALWAEVRDVAYRTLRTRGWSHDRADDGAQDTVLKLQEVLAKGMVLHNPAGWAATVAHRKAIDHHRRARLAGARPEHGGEGRDASGADADAETGDAGADFTVDPVGSLERFLAHGVPTSLQAIQREQVERLIEALDERDLQMAWLTAEGLKQAEIGEELGIGEEGVRKALQRLRKRLRDRADELGIAVEVLDHPRIY
jgi:RNA polymerase sigma factor (sigma-70 family)